MSWALDYPREAAVLARLEYRGAPHRCNWPIYWELAALRAAWEAVK